MKRKLFLSPILLLLLVLSVSAQKPQPASAAQQDLRKHIEYLASDKLEGRRTGEPGATAAAKYVAQEFAKTKLTPGFVPSGGGKRTFLQPFPHVTDVSLAASGNSLEIFAGGKRLSLTLKNEWMPVGFSGSNAVSELPLVEVGYGISARNLGYDDYAGLDVKGAVVLAWEGSPNKDLDRFADVRYKAIAARDAGAKALIVLGRKNAEGSFDLTYDNYGSEEIPVASISVDAINKLYELRSNISSTGVGSTSPDGTDTKYLDDRTTTTTPDGVRTVKMSDGTTYTYHVKLRKEGNRTYTERDKKTSIMLPGAHAPFEIQEDDVDRETFGSRASNLKASLSVHLERRAVDAYNVIGILEGSDPQLKNEAIIIGAHYDHLGHGGSGSLAANSTEIHHGADDNASGTTAVIELARQFAKEKRPKRTLIFMTFGGEEEGLLGSKFYVNNPAWPLEKTVAMINLDMVGRLNENKLTVGGIGTATEWNDVIQAANNPTIRLGQTGSLFGNITKSNEPVKSNETALFALQLNQDGFGPSDHSSFYGKNIPVLFFFTGTHADYHKPSDTADKINYLGLQRIILLVRDVARSVAQSPTRPTYAVAKSSGQMGQVRLSVSLGTIPSYGDTTDGMILDGVRDNSPASKAGLKAGDKIVKLAGKDVRNAMDYTYVLGSMKAGEEYEIELIRGTERMTLKIIPAPSARRP